jgi:hypothetical protein
MNKSPELLTQPTIVVVPWVDPVVDAAGASLFSRYVELYWLPVLGPSALWILRRIAMGFETFPAGYELDCAATANDIGLSFTLVATLLVFRSHTASPGRSGGALLLACN